MYFHAAHERPVHAHVMGFLFLILALTLNAAANVLLKVGSGGVGSPGEPEFIGRLVTNFWLLAGVLLFALNVAFYIAALTRLNLSLAYPIMVAGGIVIVVSISILVLREPVNSVQIVGIVLVAQRSFA